ncbi:hypothetical protein TW85_17190 [Marinomonas sp. S3726]|nr:hypothetical protein TW85_17190 [Marinomonas sp. S3726]
MNIQMTLIRKIIYITTTCVKFLLLILSVSFGSVYANQLKFDPSEKVHGLWQVSGTKYCVYDCGTSHPDYDPGIGRILSFNSSYADNGEDNCTDVNYLVRYIDRDAWKIEDIASGEIIKLAEKHIPTVTLHCGVRNKRWDKFGTWITFLDNNTILLSYKGYAIQAKRI